VKGRLFENPLHVSFVVEWICVFELVEKENFIFLLCKIQLHANVIKEALNLYLLQHYVLIFNEIHEGKKK